ncbi:MAG: GNAT family N-acetyltransferase [Xenococcaceae cyanobacterium MO_167.B27]|nr:GNAT family N-acetyltransferase [Xenococcaceae cyanobacterium MO_167.B27]
MSSKIVTETKRLLLRHFTLEDAQDLAILYGDPVVRKFLGLRNYEETLKSLEWIFKCYDKYGYGLWAVIHKADNKLIGRCGLIAQNIEGVREVEIAYMLSKDYWGQGIGTEAACAIRDYGFEIVGCKRMISLIDPDNIASCKVASKVGLTYEKDVILEDKPVRVYAIDSPN